VMSYCSGNHFSDYNYRKIQTYLSPLDARINNGATISLSGPQELLLISGNINLNKASLNPVKSLFGTARVPQEGPYTLRISTANRVVDYRFAGEELDHLPNVRNFSFTVPNPGQIVGIAVYKDGVALGQIAGSSASASGATPNGTAPRVSDDAPQVQAVESNGVLNITWDAARYTYLSVTHVSAARTTLALDLRGGKASLPLLGLPAGGSFEFGLSDGLNTKRLVKQR